MELTLTSSFVHKHWVGTSSQIAFKMLLYIGGNNKPYICLLVACFVVGSKKRGLQMSDYVHRCYEEH